MRKELGQESINSGTSAKVQNKLLISDQYPGFGKGWRGAANFDKNDISSHLSLSISVPINRK